MEEFMHSITANLKKAHDDRRRAETEIYSSQNSLSKSILKAESCAENRYSNPQSSRHTPVSKTKLYRGNQKAVQNTPKVLWNPVFFII